MASQKKILVIMMTLRKRATRAPTAGKTARERRKLKRKRGHGAQGRRRPNPSRRIRRLLRAQRLEEPDVDVDAAE